MSDPTIDEGCSVCGRKVMSYIQREDKNNPGVFNKYCYGCDPDRPKYKPIESDGLTGWICPVCGSGVSPFTSLCPCCSIPYKVSSQEGSDGD